MVAQRHLLLLSWALDINLWRVLLSVMLVSFSDTLSIQFFLIPFLFSFSFLNVVHERGCLTAVRSDILLQKHDGI